MIDDIYTVIILTNPHTHTHTNREFNLKEDLAGLSECIKQRLILPYPVLYERKSSLVARTKMTVVVGKVGLLVLLMFVLLRLMLRNE